MTDIIIQMQSGSKAFGPKVLFNQASVAVNEGEHIGVIGPNGAGKSTLFKALLEPEMLDEGTVTRSRGKVIGHLAQEEKAEDATRVADYLEKNVEMPLWELKKWGLGLGLDDEHFEKAMNELSGGFRMRVKLLRLIGQKCDLLMLDEPTNYLDLESLVVLENFLQGFDGAFLLISHDREFLKRTTDHTLEVEFGEITKYNGNIDDYFEQKAMLAEMAAKQALSQELKRKKILDFANRFRAKATKARQVQSKLKLLDKMQQIELKEIPNLAKIPIPEPIRTGKQILVLNDAQMGYPDHQVLHDVNFRVDRGDHIGVVGVNGAGKSTLLKTLARRLELLGGSCDWGYRAEYGYFAQHVAEALDPKDTVYEAMISEAHPEVLPQQVKDLAGGLLFNGEDIDKKIGVLSGGEKTRVALGQILLKKAPILILDEPTNHLDFHTVEALTRSLQSFTGTVIIVSHDRGFVSRVSSKILEIRDGKVDLYPGSYDEYVWSLQRGVLREKNIVSAPKTSTKKSPQEPETASKAPPRNHSVSLTSEQKKRIRQIKSEVSALDREIEKQNRIVSSLTEKLVVVQGRESEETAKELGHQQTRLDELEEQWMDLANQLDIIEKGKG